jgi:hypothetical protein
VNLDISAKSFYVVSLGTQRKSLTQKNENKNSHATIPLNQNIAGATFVREAGALKVRPDLDRLLGQFPLDVVNQDLHKKKERIKN